MRPLPTVIALAKQVGKTPVEVQDYPGFVANRVLMPMINEAVYCVMEGVATPEAVDTVMKLGHEPSNGAVGARRPHWARHVPRHPRCAARRVGRPEVPRVPAASKVRSRWLARAKDEAGVPFVRLNRLSADGSRVSASDGSTARDPGAGAQLRRGGARAACGRMGSHVPFRAIPPATTRRTRIPRDAGS